MYYIERVSDGITELMFDLESYEQAQAQVARTITGDIAAGVWAWYAIHAI